MSTPLQELKSDLFRALAHPTRIRILERLIIGSQSVQDLQTALTLDQPIVSQHLAALKEAGLVRDRRDGNRRVYSADPTGLAALREYLERYWDSALEAFEQAAADAKEAKKANEAKAKGRVKETKEGEER